MNGREAEKGELEKKKEAKERAGAYDDGFGKLGEGERNGKTGEETRREAEGTSRRGGDRKEEQGREREGKTRARRMRRGVERDNTRDGEREGRKGDRGDVSCADGLREHRSKFHAVMSLQKRGM